ncbi:Iml3p [Saccharomyces cerevisiae YJM1199]|nr:Iml3p [Saccharomyces cerevisiae YJM1199]CAI4969634.1 BTE_HP_G0033460.mRNA.1.CDS.1 [Saccharomyces cerevisiae]CAI5008435.1 BTE_HP_G0064110.mRNA.1.CDS.1 [Saccharomyces cerevisiae]CAI5032878.1 BTE_HP_G0085610.mRNA.1.CDS.1 [Saccharomyces cerevisiae]CAI6732262.1 BTE_HP_G0033460.mRNA.1.CDS.1 [Saccharomyces cerevisiae]
MPYTWKFLGISKQLPLENGIAQLNQLLNLEVDLDIQTIRVPSDPDGGTAADEYFRYEMRLDISNLDEGTYSKFIFLGNSKMEVPMFLCYCGTDNRNEVVLQWLKAEYGVIMWPIKFEQKTMIKLADASIVHVTKENIEQITWFSSKLYFEPETQDKNLRQFSIEIPRESCEGLALGYGNTMHPYNDAIVPYIYNETGMAVERLPLTSVILAGHTKIMRESIVTSTRSLRNRVLAVVLQSIQFTSE